MAGNGQSKKPWRFADTARRGIRTSRLNRVATRQDSERLQGESVIENPTTVSDSLLQPRRVSAGRGSHWIDSGWQIFRKAPFRWLAMFLLSWSIAIVISRIPYAGQLLALLLNPVLIGGLLLGVQSQANGGTLQPSHLIAGFRHAQRSQLLLLGLIAMMLIMLLGIGTMVVLNLIGDGLRDTAQVIDATAARRSGQQHTAMLTLAAIGGLLLGAMASLAPHLVLFNQRSPLDALRLSFAAALTNIGALFVFVLESLLISLALAIPLIAGSFANSIAIMVAGGLILASWLVVLTVSSYFAWLDIFSEEPPRGPLAGPGDTVSEGS